MGYAELLCLTNFSFQLGASHPRELVQRAKELGYSALAITDECSLAGIVRAHEAAEALQLPLIIGSQFRFVQGDRIALLAPTQEAYTQLCELITKARRRVVKGTYMLTREDFDAAVSATIALWIPGEQLLAKTVQWFAGLPVAGRYITYSHHLAQDSTRRLDSIRELGQKFGLPVAAVGDVH
jgi:error-prone DNA polymerase